MILFPYLRCSTEKQEDSPQVQQESIQRYSVFTKAELRPFYTDFAVSARKIPFEQRDAGRRLWQDVQFLRKTQPNAEIGIVCSKLDRIFRNSVDGIISEQSFRDIGIYLHFSDMGGVAVNTRTAIGRMIFRMMLSIAEWEADTISERTTDAAQSRKKAGRKYSTEPFGYKTVNRATDESGKVTYKGDLVPHETEYEVASMLVYQFDNKLSSLSKMAAILNEQGIKPKTGARWSHGQVSSVIRTFKSLTENL